MAAFMAEVELGPGPPPRLRKTGRVPELGVRAGESIGAGGGVVVGGRGGVEEEDCDVAVEWRRMGMVAPCGIVWTGLEARGVLWPEVVSIESAVTSCSPAACCRAPGARGVVWRAAVPPPAALG